MRNNPRETLERPESGDFPMMSHGYPIAYMTADDGTLCAACANGGNGSEAAAADLDPECPSHDQWRITDAVFTGNYEYPEGLRCDHCHTFIVMPEGSNDA